MNTAIICFGKSNDYLRNKQLKQVLKEENEKQAILCEDYDELDRLVPILKEKNVSKLLILHEEYNIDRFERAAHAEYDHLFEVEIGIDYSRTQLREGDQVSRQQAQQNAIRTGTAEKGTQENINADILWVFPFNSPVLGVNNVINKMSIKADPQTMVIANIVPLNCAENGYWGMNACENTLLLKNSNHQSLSGQWALARTIKGLQNLFPNVKKIYGPKALITAAGGTATNDILYNINTQAAVNAYKLGVEINSTPIKNADQNKVKEWTDKSKIHKLGFLAKCLADIQWAEDNKGKDITVKNGKKDIADALLNRLGVYEDLKALSGMASEAGYQMAVDLLLFAKDMVEKHQEKENNSKLALVASHNKFNEFAQCFDDEGCFVEGKK